MFSARVAAGVSTVYLESQQVINSATEESSRSHLTGGLNHGELNLGFTALDARENVLRNRERLLAGIFGEVLPLVTLRQIHSPLIHRVTRLHAGEAAVLHGDGMMTDDPGVVLGVQTADCVPVLLADPTRGAVAVFHAGWRGTLERIVEKGCRADCGSPSAQTRPAWLQLSGPPSGHAATASGQRSSASFDRNLQMRSTCFAAYLKRELRAARPKLATRSDPCRT